MDFACKTFNLNEIVRCILNLTKSEFKILDFLIKNHLKRISSKKISESLKLDLSTIQRAMKKFAELKLVKRSQENNSPRGYILYYCICDKKEIKEIIKSSFKKWNSQFENELEKW